MWVSDDSFIVITNSLQKKKNIIKWYHIKQYWVLRI